MKIGKGRKPARVSRDGRTASSCADHAGKTTYSTETAARESTASNVLFAFHCSQCEQWWMS